MAAAIIPLVSAAIAAVGPRIPGIISFVEGLFGHSDQTGQKDGPVKLETAVAMLETALQHLANAGKIPSAPVVDPSLPAGLAGAVQQAFDALRAQGSVDGALAAPLAVPPTASQPFNFPFLGKWEITAVRL